MESSWREELCALDLIVERLEAALSSFSGALRLFVGYDTPIIDHTFILEN